jgi:hypothetical protein
MQRRSVQSKKVDRVPLWIFLQTFAGVKEIIEPERPSRHPRRRGFYETWTGTWTEK